MKNQGINSGSHNIRWGKNRNDTYSFLLLYINAVIGWYFIFHPILYSLDKYLVVFSDRGIKKRSRQAKCPSAPYRKNAHILLIMKPEKYTL